MILILSIVIFILLAYLFFIKKEMKNITYQLNKYNQFKSRKKIDIKLFDKDLEQLAKTINNHIDVNTKLMIKQQDMEDELKRSIANISHDIRTPLTSILGYIQMSKREEISSNKRAEYMDIAEERGKILKEILEKFFSLSVVQSTDYILDLSYINLNNILYEVVACFYEKFEESDVDVNLEIEHENINILGEELAINRVVQNLISNMIKYSEGNESIILSKEDDCAKLILSNKIGNISKKEENLLFNRFYKQDLSRSSSDSSGLGLPIAKTLMEKMQGNIEVEINKDTIYFICTWKLGHIQ